MLTTLVKKWGNAIEIVGRGEVRFSLGDAVTWPHLTSPQSRQPQYKHSRRPRALAVRVPKPGSHFTQQSQLLARPTVEATVSGRSSRLCGRGFALPPLVHTLPRPRNCHAALFLEVELPPKLVATHEMESVPNPELEECLRVGNVLLGNPWSALPHFLGNCSPPLHSLHLFSTGEQQYYRKFTLHPILSASHTFSHSPPPHGAGTSCIW